MTALTYNGLTRPLSEWARLTGIPALRIHSRLCLGWSDRDALFVPAGAERPRKRAPKVSRAVAAPKPAPEGGAEAQDRGVGLDLQEKTGTGGGTVAQEIHQISFADQEDAA